MRLGSLNRIRHYHIITKRIVTERFSVKINKSIKFFPIQSLLKPPPAVIYYLFPLMFICIIGNGFRHPPPIEIKPLSSPQHK